MLPFDLSRLSKHFSRGLILLGFSLLFGTLQAGPPVFNRPLRTASVNTLTYFELINSKLVGRLMNRSGPIPQPNIISIISPDFFVFNRLGQTWTHLSEMNHYDLLASNGLPVLGLKRLAVLMVEGNTPYQMELVFKSNGSVSSEGVLMISPEKDALLFSFLLRSWRLPTTEKLTHRLDELGLPKSAISIDESTRLVQIRVSRKHEVAADQISEILMHIMQPTRNYADIAILETRAPGIKINGGAYETRHRFSARLGSNEIFTEGIAPLLDLAGYPNEGERLARIGSTAYFTFTSGQAAEGSKAFHADNIFEPLIQTHHLQRSQLPEFEERLNTLLESFWAHLSAQFVSDGLQAVENSLIEVEVDLMWLASETGELPTPMLTEFKVSTKKPEAFQFGQSLSPECHPSLFAKIGAK